MSKFQIEYEFDMKMCDPLMFDMITSCGFNDYPATNAGTVRIKVETDEMPTRDEQVKFIQENPQRTFPLPGLQFIGTIFLQPAGCLFARQALVRALEVPE